jgi:hypothetical protein
MSSSTKDESGSPAVPAATTTSELVDRAAQTKVREEKRAQAEGELEERLRDWTQLVLRQSEKITNTRTVPILVLSFGVLMVIFFPLVRMVPDDGLLLTDGEAMVGVGVGGLLILGGAILSLLATVLPFRSLNNAAQALTEQRQALLQTQEENLAAADAELRARRDEHQR